MATVSKRLIPCKSPSGVGARRLGVEFFFFFIHSFFLSLLNSCSKSSSRKCHYAPVAAGQLGIGVKWMKPNREGGKVTGVCSFNQGLCSCNVGINV